MTMGSGPDDENGFVWITIRKTLFRQKPRATKSIKGDSNGLAIVKASDEIINFEKQENDLRGAKVPLEDVIIKFLSWKDDGRMSHGL